jgi:transposase
MIFTRKSRMPVRVQRRLLEQFVAGATARTAAQLLGVQERTAVVFFQRLRRLIASKQTHVLLSGEINVDVTDVAGAKQGRSGQVAAGRVPVFGLLMRDGRIHTAIIPDADSTAGMQERVTPDGIIYTKSAPACAKLNVSEFRYTGITPGKTVLSRSGYHISGIENFWNESRRYLRRFNGIPKTSFYWYLKECEWRFNGSDHHALSEQLTNWYQSEIHKS